MNRRSFLRTALTSAAAVSAFPTLAFNSRVPRRIEDRDIQDLLLWAPYEAFLPEETDPVVQDPSDGTQTGVLKAADIIRGTSLTLQFWHEHDGIWHMFTLTPDNFVTLKSGNPVVIYVPTTVVEDHYHMVIVDPNKPA